MLPTFFIYSFRYDPSEFESLNVSPEIRELFSHIMRYTPQTVDLETRFKPFIPEYIPAVGDIDAFIKVPRPGEENTEEVMLKAIFFFILMKFMA